MKPETYNKIYGWIFAVVFTAAVIALILLVSSAYACPENEPGIYTDCTVWAVDADTRELCGTFAPDEAVKVLPIQNSGNRVRGFLEGGFVIRVAARARVLCAGETLLGLNTLDNTRIEIDGEYLPLVSEVVWRTLGDDVEICGGSITACMIDFRDGTATDRLYTKYTGYVAVGKAFYNTDITDGDWLIIALGDWDGDGLLDLGLVAGSAPEPVKEPEISANIENNNAGEKENCTETAQTVKKQECLKIEFNLHFLIQYCQRWFGK